MKHRIIYMLLIVLTICSIGVFRNRCYAQKKLFIDASNLNGTWKLVPVLASDTATGKLAVIQFNVSANSFTGNTGCNTMSGKVTVNGNMLSFKEQVVDTRNACQGYNEDAFMANLLKVNHFKIENGVLQLMVDQTVLSKWVKKEPGPGVKTI